MAAFERLSGKLVKESARLVWVLLLLGAAGTAAAQSAAPALPPAPDSLRSALKAARTPAARTATYLRVAAALAVVPDSAGVAAYAGAAEDLARDDADSAAVGRSGSLRGFVLLQQGAAAAAAPLLHRAEALLAAAPLAWQADNHAYLAWLLGDTNQPVAALRYLRRAYAEYGRQGNAAAQADLSGTATVVYLFQGRPDSAAYVLLRAARQQHRLGLVAEEAITLGNLATVLHQLGRLPEADRYARQALASMQQQRSDDGQAAVYQTLGNIAWARHRPAEAVGYFREAIGRLRRLQELGNLIPCYGSMAGAMSDLQQPDSAVYYQLQAVRLCQQLGQTTPASIEMAALAVLYQRQHRWAEAEQWAKASLAGQRDQKLQNTRPLKVLAAVAEHRGNYPEALRLERRIQALLDARYRRENQELVQKERARYDTDRAEQQVSLLTAQTRVQAQTRELDQLRARQQLAALGGLALLGTLLAGGLLWNYRRRQAARDTALRQRLAADLHDDVGALLTQISLQSDLLREAPAPPEATLARLNRLSDTSRRAARQMADVVWGLHTSSAQLPEVLAHMRDHAYEVLADADLAVDFAVSPAAAALRPGVAVCQNLYLIYKEALHNVVKHAPRATRVTVRLSEDAGQLCLAVRDDAPGPAAAFRPGGHGLANMRQRAEAVGGTLHFAAEAAGFEVVACLPG
ncbi:MAG: histidine kinase [Hymenobacter sp.]|nr:histidine kinase [Hymenobacter sp.]